MKIKSSLSQLFDVSQEMSGWERKGGYELRLMVLGATAINYWQP
jgi:hypothetical protein